MRPPHCGAAALRANAPADRRGQRPFDADEKFLKRLSIAALETLAIVAYKQPITKGEIESIRGVNSDYSIQKLLEKELIIIMGRNEDMPGKPLIYTTSKTFMDYFGINQAADLPKLREVLGENLEELSLINYKPVTPEINPALVVSEEGELLENNPSSPEQDDKA